MEFYEGFSRHVHVIALNTLTPSGKFFTHDNELDVQPRGEERFYTAPPVYEDASWKISKSIFKNYKFDTPELMKDCFDNDWKRSNLNRVITDIYDLSKVKKILSSNY